MSVPLRNAPSRAAPAPARVAALQMYAGHPRLEAANRALWHRLRAALRARGLDGVPTDLARAAPHEAAWHDPALLLAQTCGYPYVHHLRGRVRLVATPTYAAPGCRGPFHRSLVVVRRNDPVRDLPGLRGRRAALNDPHSNSGMNLFRAALAPHAGGQPLFAAVLHTGSHAASLLAVREGRADVAAIDGVTFANISRCAPARVAGLRILAETLPSPGLPLVTRGTAPDGEVALLREALAATMADPALTQARAALGLTGVAVLADGAYDAVLALEADAVAANYPVLA